MKLQRVLVFLTLLYSSSVFADAPAWAREKLIQKQVEIVKRGHEQTVPVRRILGLKAEMGIKSLIVTAATKAGRGKFAVVLGDQVIHREEGVPRELTTIQIRVERQLGRRHLKLKTTGNFYIPSIAAIVAIVAEPLRYQALCIWDNDDNFSFSNRQAGEVSGANIKELYYNCWKQSRAMNRRGKHSASLKQIRAVTGARGLYAGHCKIMKRRSQHTPAFDVGIVYGETKANAERECAELARRTWPGRGYSRVFDR